MEKIKISNFTVSETNELFVMFFVDDEEYGKNIFIKNEGNDILFRTPRMNRFISLAESEVTMQDIERLNEILSQSLLYGKNKVEVYSKIGSDSALILKSKTEEHLTLISTLKSIIVNYDKDKSIIDVSLVYLS